MKLILLFIILSSALVGCSLNSTGNYSPNCGGTAKSYKKDVLPIFQSSCMQCHNNFGSYSAIYSDRNSINNYVSSGSMPQNSSLTNAQKDAIICWIQSGAPNN